MEPLVLTVDMAGLPQAWVELEEAITYHAKHLVAWSVGEFVREYRGGYQRNGERSRIATKLILAIKGSGAVRYGHAPGLTNALLFAPIASCAHIAARGSCCAIFRVIMWCRSREAAGTCGPTPSPRAGAATRPKVAALPSRRTCRCSIFPCPPARALHPAQSAHSRRPDGVSARGGAQEQPAVSFRSAVVGDLRHSTGASSLTVAADEFAFPSSLRRAKCTRRVDGPREIHAARPSP